jgi:hypothetical protein
MAFGYRNRTFHSTPHWSPGRPYLYIAHLDIEFPFNLKVAFGYRNGSFHSTPHWSPGRPYLYIGVSMFTIFKVRL